MRQFTLILLCSFCYFTSFGQWTQVSSLPSTFQTHHSFAFSIDDIGYIVTGVANNGFRKDFYRYDADVDEWTKLQDYPGPRRGFGIGDVYNGKAYVGFGITDGNVILDDLWSYDPSTDTWEELASCPCDGRLHPAFVANDGKIFMGMGNNNNGNLNDWWEYDIATDSWSQKPNFPGLPRHHPFQFVANGEVYAGFGHGDTFISKNWYRYESDTETWVQVADLPDEGRVAGTQFSHGGKGYALSGDGENHSSMVFGEFWEYNAVTDQWKQLPSHPGNSRWAPSSFVINNEVYIINGQSSQIYQSAIFKYALDPPVSTGELAEVQEELEVFPNPVQAEINLRFKDFNLVTEDMQIKIYNAASQLLYQANYQPQLDLSSLPSGLLFIELSDQDKTYHSRVVKY